MLESKKIKKIKPGKKNWKKIDITDMEKTNTKIAHQNFMTKRVENLKDNELFSLDTIKNVQTKLKNRN
jgi:hypothetical protein